MTDTWLDGEDCVFDCWGDPPPKEPVGPEILDVNWGLHLQFPEDDKLECLDCCAAADDVEEIQYPKEYGPLTTIPIDQCSRADTWGDVRIELELDLLPQEIMAGMEVTRPSYERSIAAKSASFSAVAASALIHICLFLLLVFVPEPQVAGAAGNTGNVISVRIGPSDDLIPQDESPSAVDSAASMPSIAGKTRRDKKVTPLPTVHQPPETQAVDPAIEKVAVHEKPKPDEKKEENAERPKEPVKNPEELNAGEGLKNSIASLASTASVERRFIPAAGPEGKAFESLVLSAIREVIFFPKKALKERHHGEVVVKFVIAKDGSISGLHIAKTSGSSILDEAALKIVRKAGAKFPPIPETWNKESVDYVVPIVFKEKRQ